MSPRNSDITVTDQFCGAGGSSIGATKAGLRVRMAMNHWKLAVETHNTNFPNTDHDCCDISASDPRRYPSTDILITSPECTTHSPAGGNRRRSASQSDLFTPAVDDPTVERSRATMWDVPRFAEYHRYRRIIVENVVEVLRWELFDVWLQAMHALGYEHRIVSLNSMFCWPTPQSRDRVYINFWRKGDLAPDLDIRPKAPCPRCGIVEARQTWKNGRTVGKYRFQYVYTCPTCRVIVTPFYYAALNAIDFSVAAQKIGDRKRPLRDRTLARIKFGLEKYGRRALLVRTNMTSGLETRVRGLEEPLFTQTASWLDGMYAPFGMVSPFTVETAYSHSGVDRVGGADEPLRTQSTRLTGGLVSPFIVNGHMSRRVHGVDGPLSTQSASREHDSLVFGDHFMVRLRGTEASHLERSASGLDEPTPTFVASGMSAALIGPGFMPFFATLREHNVPRGIDEPAPVVSTGGNHLLVQGAAQISMRDADAMRVAGLERELMSQGCAPQQAIISPSPFLTSYYGNNQASAADEAVDTVTVRDRHALVSRHADQRIEDCYFRMLQPHEIGSAMAFPRTYSVLGNKRDQVKQYGNAVTPPAMETLIDRHVASMTGERAA